MTAFGPFKFLTYTVCSDQCSNPKIRKRCCVEFSIRSHQSVHEASFENIAQQSHSPAIFRGHSRPADDGDRLECSIHGGFELWHVYLASVGGILGRMQRNIFKTDITDVRTSPFICVCQSQFKKSSTIF